YSTAATPNDTYAVRTSAGTTSVALPATADYLYPRALSGLLAPAFVAASSFVSGGTEINDKAFLVTTSAGKPNAPIELSSADGRIIGFQDGILYYRASGELRAITGDGKYKRTFGPAKKVAITGSPFTGIFVVNDNKVSFLAPGKYTP